MKRSKVVVYLLLSFALTGGLSVGYAVLVQTFNGLWSLVNILIWMGFTISTGIMIFSVLGAYFFVPSKPVRVVPYEEFKRTCDTGEHLITITEELEVVAWRNPW